MQQTGTYLGQRAGSWDSWVTWGKGIYNPELTLTASFREIIGVELRRAHHTISVIGGRAYIFGGESSIGILADNTMHVVILPSSNVQEADFKSIAARPLVKDGPVPDPRKGHTAVVIENEIYIFGGELSGKAKEEAARVWLFDTISNKWSFHDPKADAPYPPPRFDHAAVASDQPGPLNSVENTVDLVKQEQDASKTVPEPPENDSWGTMFIYGGIAIKEEGVEVLNDAWAFDVATRSWLVLPPPPTPARSFASLILSGNHLYRAGGGSVDGELGASVDSLDVGELFRALSLGKAFSRLALPTLLREWTTFPLSAAVNAPSITEAISSGGRRFLVALPAGAKNVAGIDVTPASSIRLAGAEAPESDQNPIAKQVVLAKVQYTDAYGDIIETRRVFSQQEGFASSAGTDVDAASVVVWGGLDASGNLLSNGWMVTVE
ncbi:galactose oxidase [Tothia fuscella]|uniref:Galactose oxidase n=1 Tax=Tothia fuscella TaxID=1048955 RepID=A0A9P4NP99_9PEZI|nr:galactose oxidase [Tothia fuscella]